MTVKPDPVNSRNVSLRGVLLNTWATETQKTQRKETTEKEDRKKGDLVSSGCWPLFRRLQLGRLGMQGT